MHRGSKTTGGCWRPEVIAHYSGRNYRPDMTHRATNENGQTHALFDTPLV